MASFAQSSRHRASNHQQRRHRVNTDLDAQYMYHDGGALFFPRPPSPEHVPSVAMLPPDSVPSAAATRSEQDSAEQKKEITELKRKIAQLEAENRELRGMTQVSSSAPEGLHQFSVIKEEDAPSSSPESDSDTSKKLIESEEDYQSSEDEESEDDSSVFSSECSNEASEPLADESRKPLKRNYQEDQNHKDVSAKTTRPSKRLRKCRHQENEKWNQRHMPDPTLSVHPAPNDDDGSVARSIVATKWDARLEGLKKFKATHGHCRIPASSGVLYQWLYNQYNRCLDPSHSGYLKDVPERERRTKELESVLGINLTDWASLLRARSTTDATKWDAHLEELKKFKAIHGHCKVPISSRSLSVWLGNQQTTYLNPNHSECLKDVSERERRTKELESVLGKNLRDCTYHIRWDERLEELKKFKAKHGHCRIPKSSGSLYIWLRDQRVMFLNRSHSRYLQDVLERERRTKEIESVLGTSLCDRQRKAEPMSTKSIRTTRTRRSTIRRRAGRS